MADRTQVIESYQRTIDTDRYRAIRELYKSHSVAEDARDLDGLIATLTDDCAYELPQSGHRWEGHDGARAFYTELLTAFPDIDFHLTSIVIGPQGVFEEADVRATWQGEWLGQEPTGAPVAFQVLILFPYDPDAERFAGERVYVASGDPTAVPPA